MKSLKYVSVLLLLVVMIVPTITSAAILWKPGIGHGWIGTTPGEAMVIGGTNWLAGYYPYYPFYGAYGGYPWGGAYYNPPGVGPYNPPGFGAAYYNPPGVGPYNPPGFGWGGAYVNPLYW